MDDSRAIRTSEKGMMTDGRKHQSDAVKDIKRKLSCMNKKINDLHHQRKFAYKNSVKAKKMVHNQVNQIVKCLRARERILWSEVDEAFLSQDADVSEELSKLQSIHARCLTLVNHSSDFKGDVDVMSKVNSMFADVNFGERPAAKPLEFVSDFEAMKTRASNYGHLDGDFIQKDDFVFVIDKENNEMPQEVPAQLVNQTVAEGACKQTIPVANIDTTTSKIYLDKLLVAKDDCDAKDAFQIIDLSGNVGSHDAEDYIMQVEDENSDNSPQSPGKVFCRSPFVELLLSERERKVDSTCINSENHEVKERNDEFNPDEEWKQLQEINKRFAEITSMFNEEQMNHKLEKAVQKCDDVDKSSIKNCKQNRFMLLQEADCWLCSSNSSKDVVCEEEKVESVHINMNLTSPADLIRKAFKPYLRRDNIKNWLSSD